MLTVGLTGDVGAGKSTVAKVWKEQGAHLIDSDELVHSLWKSKKVREAALVRFGKSVIDSRDGSIDSALLSRAVFSNEEDYKWICALLHPLVFEEILKRKQCIDGWVVIELPLLFEAGRRDWLDLVVYLTALKKTRILRTKRRGWSESELFQRERWLKPSCEKAALSEIVIENDGSLQDLENRVRILGNLMKSMADSLDRGQRPEAAMIKLLLEAHPS